MFSDVSLELGRYATGTTGVEYEAHNGGDFPVIYRSHQPIRRFSSPASVSGNMETGLENPGDPRNSRFSPEKVRYSFSSSLEKYLFFKILQWFIVRRIE